MEGAENQHICKNTSKFKPNEFLFYLNNLYNTQLNTISSKKAIQEAIGLKLFQWLIKWS